MSIEASRWAWSCKGLRPSSKLTLLSLADRAGEKNICWPSLNRLAEDTGLNVKTVRSALKELCEKALVKRYQERGRGYIYQLHLQKSSELPVGGNRRLSEKLKRFEELDQLKSARESNAENAHKSSELSASRHIKPSEKLECFEELDQLKSLRKNNAGNASNSTISQLNPPSSNKVYPPDYGLLKKEGATFFAGSQLPKSTGVTAQKSKGSPLKRYTLNNKKSIRNSSDNLLRNTGSLLTEKTKKLRFGSFQNVLLSQDEHNRLLETYGEKASLAIDKLDVFIGSRGDSYKSHYMTMHSWVLKAVDEDLSRQKRLSPNANGKPDANGKGKEIRSFQQEAEANVWSAFEQLLSKGSN